MAVVGACVAARVYWEPAAAIAEPADARQAPAANQAKKAAKAAAPAKSEIPEVVAVVNAERITRNDLARECLRLYGEEVLEMLINKRLIAQHCRERGVSVTKKEVQDEIDRMAQ
ncbi:MAG: peptidylprolyl isomerase, partial [Pirellulales bacterium]